MQQPTTLPISKSPFAYVQAGHWRAKPMYWLTLCAAMSLQDHHHTARDPSDMLKKHPMHNMNSLAALSAIIGPTVLPNPDN
eukprot:scaffold577855_cov28-Prasinocladus_malaysianus.AAC.1